MKQYTDLEYLKLSKGQRLLYRIAGFFCSIPKKIGGLFVALWNLIKTAGSVLNMREQAHAQATVVAKIPNGTVINVTKSVPGWAYAKYNSFSGWVSSEFLVAAPDAAVETIASSTEIN